MNENTEETIEVPRRTIEAWYLAFLAVWECNEHGDGCRICPSGEAQLESGIRETAEYLDTPVEFLDNEQW